MASTSSLVDDFNDNSTDVTKWSSTNNGTGNTLSEATQALVITLGGTSGQYSYYDQTSATYDLTSSYVLVRVTSVPINAASNTQMFIKIYRDGTNYLTIGKNGSNLLMQSVTAGVDSSTTTTYLDGQMGWWRIRNEGSNILWETSATGRDWVTRRTLANPWVITTVGIQLGAGSFGADSSPGTATFDSVNVPPVNRPISLADSFTSGSGVSVVERAK